MGQKATVLFVDDEERILRSLKMLFISHYHVLTASNGAAAIELARQHTIHVVVSDQRMPGMTGVEVLREIKQVSPNTLRLLLTGYADLTAIVGSINEGEIFRYINKPWKGEELKAAVQKAADIALKLFSSSPSSPVTHAASAPKPGLLVIDDDIATHHAVEKLLSTQAPVHWGRTLEEAFSILSQHPIAVVIAEVHIGAEDIASPLKTLKQYNPEILTIILTSFQDTSALIDLINHGQIYRFLPKPLHEGLLGKSLHAALQHYQAIQTRPVLLMPHAVEKPSDDSGNRISSRVMEYLKKIRGRGGQAAVVN